MSLRIDDNTIIKWEDEGKHYLVHIIRDQYVDDPREWDNVGVMACWHHRYTLGDQNDRTDFERPEYFWQNLVHDHVPGMNYYRSVDNDFTIQQCQELLKDYAVWLPLYLLDHSGLTMSTEDFGDPWDSGQVGWYVITKEEAFKAFSEVTEENWKERAKAYIRGEVETYDQYLRGEVYGYKLYSYTPKCKWSTSDDMTYEDSCYGFYGDDVIDNGISDNCPGLEDAINENRYELGEATLRSVFYYSF